MGIAAKSDKLRTLFFYYFMRNIKMELLAESTTVPSVRKSRLEAYEIDIPSLDEQKIIEGKLTILSKVINLKEKQLLKLDELVKARFMEMFGDPNHNPKGYKKDIIKDHIVYYQVIHLRVKIMLIQVLIFVAVLLLCHKKSSGKNVFIGNRQLDMKIICWIIMILLWL